MVAKTPIKKKKLSVIQILIIVILLSYSFIHILFIRSNRKFPNILNILDRTNNQIVSGFNSVDDPMYTFYYPKSFVKTGWGESLSKEKVIHTFKNPNSTANKEEQIYLWVSQSDTMLDNPTNDWCKAIVGDSKDPKVQLLVAEVAMGGLGDGNGVGCKIVVQYKEAGINDYRLNIWKFLFDATQKHPKIYHTRTSHYELATSDVVKQELESAIDKFTLK